MIQRFYPSEHVASVFAIDYAKLLRKGYRAVIFDIDNTLVHHGDDSTPEVDDLIRSIQALGMATFLLTDNDRPRVERFLRNIESQYICDAEKPNPQAYLKALEILNLRKDQVVVVGDQVFTDVAGARGVGLDVILVDFIREPGVRKIGKKRWIEKLILWMYRRNKKAQHRMGDILKEE